jgi:hypothetical protein
MVVRGLDLLADRLIGGPLVGQSCPLWTLVLRQF